MGRLQLQAQPPPTVLYLQKAFEQDTVAHSHISSETTHKLRQRERERESILNPVITTQ